MTDYDPPLVNLPIFDKLVFINPDDYITQSQADKRYLKYPNAQGTENLQTTNINGVLTVNSTSNFNNTVSLTSSTPSDRRVISSYYEISDINNNVSRTSEIYQDGTTLNITNEATGGITKFINDDTSGTPTTVAEFGVSTNIAFFRSLSMRTGSNLSFSSGGGYINQSNAVGDITTKNYIKLTDFSFYSNNTNGTATSFGFFDATDGKGLYLLPNSDNGSYSDTNRRNDCCLTSRSTQNNNVITISNWNSNMRNGLRVFTTDINNCGLTLQCGQNTSGDWAELKMSYDRSTLTTTTTFNDVINFNPASPAINSTKRALIGLGTLSFTDNLNGGSTGTTTSTIYTDSTLVNSLNGMYYQCNINGGFHQFSARDSSGVLSTPIYYGSNITSVSNTFIVRNATTPSNRLDFNTDSALPNTTIRMRSTTAGTNASITFSCDTVSAGGTVTILPNCVLAPFTFEMRRAVQFNYSTQPFNTSQLGYMVGPTAMTTGSSIASSASERNFGSITMGFAGTYSIKVLIALAGGANHTLTECRWCLDGTSATFPSISTPTKYTPSITGIVGGSLSSTYTSYMNINLDILTTTLNQIIYVNYVLNYSGGSTTTLNATYTYTRIG